MGQRRTASRPGRSPTRRLVAAAAAVLVAGTVLAGCEDAKPTSSDDPEPEPPRDRSSQSTTEPRRSPPPDRETPPPERGRDDRDRSTSPRDGNDDRGDKPRRRDGDDDADAPGPATGAAGPQFGAVYHGMWDMTWSDRAELLDKLAATGATWVRIGVQWAALQQERPTAGDPGWQRWHLSKADRVINQAVRRGLDVSVTLLRTPDWANGGRGREALPDDPATYAQAIEWLAHRYRGRVSSWEIYNEPNNDNHLRASVGEYVRLLCAAYPAVHRGDPSAKVVFGGTSGVDYEYIDAAYERGAKGCFDVMAVHPYNGEYSPTLEARSQHRWWWRNIELVRQVMRRNNDLATPVWFTEFGWSTHPNTASTPSWERGVTYDQQARYAVQLLRITRRQYPYVERVAWYAARDETHSTVENNNFGLFKLDLRPKPIVSELRDYLAR